MPYVFIYVFLFLRKQSAIAKLGNIFGNCKGKSRIFQILRFYQDPLTLPCSRLPALSSGNHNQHSKDGEQLNLLTQYHPAENGGRDCYRKGN